MPVRPGSSLVASRNSQLGVGGRTNLTAEKQAGDLDRAARCVRGLLACQNATPVIPGGPFDGQRLRLATLTNGRALNQTRGHVDSAPSLNLVM